jgi:hypothetical protein
MKVALYVPRSIPMTWPFTFSSPPSVEFHRRNVEGSLEAGVRANAARGSCKRLSQCRATRDGFFFPGKMEVAYSACDGARKHCELINTIKREKHSNESIAE